MKTTKRIIAALLAVSTLLCCVPAVSAAGYDTIKPTSTEVSRITYSDGAYLSDVYGTYTKGSSVYNARSLFVTALPSSVSVAVGNGDNVYGKNTLTDIIKKYNKNGKRVVGAINADFFSLTTGLPLGVQIDGGKIYATNDAKYDKQSGRVSVGFKADGSTVFDVPEFAITVSVDGYQITADRVNSYPDWYENAVESWKPVIVLTSDYGAKTHWASGKAYDVIVLKADGDLEIDEDITCHYYSFLQNITQPVAIEKGKLYLVAAAGYFAGFTPPGADDTSYISVTEKTGKWKDVVSAVGAGNSLISGGVIRYPSTYDSAISTTRTSRTAFGVKADGTYVFYTAERNSNGTIAGVMMDAVAQALYDMGCVNAVNFDGGGSTTIAADKGAGAAIVNHLQGGSQRAISNALILLSDETAPVIVEDFESDKTFTELYDGTNLVTAGYNTKKPYTGSRALAIDYSLGGVGKNVGIEFEPIDVKKYDKLMLAVDMNGSGVTLEARLKTEGGVFKRPLDAEGSGYAHVELDVSDADELVGFTVTYKLAAVNRSSVYVDRIIGYRGYSLKDTSVPQHSVKVSGGKLTVSASEPAFSSGLDPLGAEVMVNGGELIRGNSVDLSTAPSDRINRARIDAVDVVGNRAAAYTLFKTNNYNTPAPFADMNDKKWDALALRYCYENGIISGFVENGQTYARGGDNVTRAQFCVMIVSQKKLDVNKYLNTVVPYEDAADIPKWALPYVRAAYAEGIMTGTKTETGVVFLPNNDITRAEAASALDRLIDKDERLTKTVTYNDEADIQKWARRFVASVSTQGLFEGDKNGNFYPNNNLTRSESAVLMSKL